ncbi:MAG: hypothetical protein AAF989_08260 [Planctomycetota bacterium]
MSSSGMHGNAFVMIPGNHLAERDGYDKNAKEISERLVCPRERNESSYFRGNDLSTNPYTPPRGVSDEELDPATRAKGLLSRPATALIVMSSIQSVLVSIALVSAVVSWSRGNLPSTEWVPIVIATLQLACLILIAVGSAKMGFLESHEMGRLAGYLACVPFVTPFLFAGIPFGIWSLRLLGDPSIRSAFPAPAGSRTDVRSPEA